MNDQSLIIALLLAPLTGAALALLPVAIVWVERISVMTTLLAAALGLAVAVRVDQEGSFEAIRGVVHVDALSSLMIVTITVVGAAAIVASIPYLRHDLAREHVPAGTRGVRLYFSGMLAFQLTMLLTVSVDNLGLLWVGLEATTFVSALLVGFYRTRAALEAAWKYLMLCTVGITCALFGVLLTYYAARQGSPQSDVSMDWSALIGQSGTLDPGIMRLAFVLVLVGFGAKAGFAPLHTWLADAHSQAPSPVSGMLSGVLLACALYGILRFQALTIQSTNSLFASRLLLAFGVLSVLVAAPFILVQRDLKRLFAYSSVEHIGLMAVSFGIGGLLGVTAGLLHLMSHAVSKGMVFFVTGDLVQRYGTRRISAIRGAMRVAPFSAWLLVGGVFALTGAPPFGMFISELMLVNAGFQDAWPEIAGVALVVAALAVIFGGILAQTLRVAYGPASISETSPAATGRSSGILLWSVLPLLALMLVLGLYVPDTVRNLIADVSAIFEPVAAGRGS